MHVVEMLMRTYTFKMQILELALLREKFEEDKKRIAKMKASRVFRPHKG